MTGRNLVFAGIAELLLLFLLAGATLVSRVDDITVPMVQIVSVSQPGVKLQANPQTQARPRGANEAVKPSTAAGEKAPAKQAGKAGAQTGSEPVSYPGDRPSPVPQSSLSVVYPKDAQNEELEGQVTLEVSVDENGHVSGTRVIQSSGHAVLDRSFAQTVQKMTFKPKREKGVDVKSTVTLKHNFRL